MPSSSEPPCRRNLHVGGQYNSSVPLVLVRCTTLSKSCHTICAYHDLNIEGGAKPSITGTLSRRWRLWGSAAGHTVLSTLQVMPICPLSELVPAAGESCFLQAAAAVKCPFQHIDPLRLPFNNISAAFGLPQQRRRLLFLASLHADARDLLLVRPCRAVEPLLVNLRNLVSFKELLRGQGRCICEWRSSLPPGKINTRCTCAGDGDAHMSRRLLGGVCRAQVLPLLPGPHAGRRQRGRPPHLRHIVRP